MCRLAIQEHTRCHSGVDPPIPRKAQTMRTPAESGRQADPPRQSSTVNRLGRAVLGLFAATRINMLEDYEKVRKFQRQLAAPLIPPARATDHEVLSTYGDHHIPVRVFHPKEQLRDEVLLFFHGGGWVIG